MTLTECERAVHIRYHIKNRLCVPSIFEMCSYLVGTCLLELVEAITRKRGRATPSVALVNTLAWVLAISDYLGGLPLVEAMAHKYGGGSCSYCDQRKCLCPPNRRSSLRGPFVARELSGHPSLKWSLEAWQEQIFRLYGDVNVGLSIEKRLLRLGSEIAEMVQNALGAMASPQMTVGERQELFATELADVIAWLFSVAEKLGIHLAREFSQSLYCRPCPECQEVFCSCGYLKREQLKATVFNPLRPRENEDTIGTQSVVP